MVIIGGDLNGHDGKEFLLLWEYGKTLVAAVIGAFPKIK